MNVQSLANCLNSPILVVEYENLLKQIGFRNIRITAKSVGGCFSNDSADPFGRSIAGQFDAAAILPEDYIASILIEAIKP